MFFLVFNILYDTTMIYVVSKVTLGVNAECFVIQFFIFMGISYGVEWGRKCEAAGQDCDSSSLFQMGSLNKL